MFTRSIHTGQIIRSREVTLGVGSNPEIGTCIQAPVVQGIRHRVYFMFLDREKLLWAWVRILKSGFDKGCFFFSLFFYICIYCIIFNNNNYILNNNKYKTTITYLTVNHFQSHKKSFKSFKNMCIF